jgi:hypothetical protein
MSLLNISVLSAYGQAATQQNLPNKEFLNETK